MKICSDVCTIINKKIIKIQFSSINLSSCNIAAYFPVSVNAAEAREVIIGDISN
jgi:hypothetical protein